MKPLELFITSLGHLSSSLWTTPSSLEGREDACAATVVGPWKDPSNFQSCADSAAAAAATGVAGDATEGKCSAEEETQPRGSAELKGSRGAA